MVLHDGSVLALPDDPTALEALSATDAVGAQGVRLAKSLT